eukprot:4375713-Pleurochrysis_carterae.AAC.1
MAVQAAVGVWWRACDHGVRATAREEGGGHAAARVRCACDSAGRGGEGCMRWLNYNNTAEGSSA